MKAQNIKEVCLRLAKTQVPGGDHWGGSEMWLCHEISAHLEVSIEEVKSFYWWDGKVNFDPEWRVSIVTSVPCMHSIFQRGIGGGS